MRGIVLFYVNIKELDKAQEIIDLTKENHVETITKLKDEGWECMFLPCLDRSSGIEKVDLKEIQNDDHDN